MEILAGFAIAGAFGLIALGVVWYSSKVEAKRAETFEAKGWTYDKRGRGFVVSGVTDGVIWEYTVRREGSGNSRRTVAFWSTPAEPSEEIVLVGPPLPEALLKMGFGGTIVQFLAKMVLGPEAADLARARELACPEPLKGKVSVVGTDSEFAEAFLSERSVASILSAHQHFDQVPAILRWKNRLEVRPTGKAMQAAETVEASVRLGVELAAAAGYSAPPSEQATEGEQE